jgi:16S rRNA (adenine1518-N6/adenine1519-N6)-dimethyltransferase
MASVTTPGGIRALLAANGVRPRRALGQSFLADARVRERMVSLAAIEAGEVVLEVGPGLGILTEGLLAAGARVLAVERDERLVRVLQQRLPHPHLTLLHADALRLSWAELLPVGGVKVVANLPYAITSPLLVGLVPWARRGGVLMVQREVGERLLAPPGTRERGAITVFCEYWGTWERGFLVPAEAFYPRPKVDSMVLRFRFTAASEPPEDFFPLVRSLFRYRRKTLRAALRQAGYQQQLVLSLGGQLPFALDARPEELHVADFLSLWRALGGERAVLPQPDQG